MLVLSVAAPALAQIVHENPGRVKAANRRALREARKADVPYKDTHLDVTREQLKRGTSETSSQPASNKKLNYKTGKAPNVKEPGLLGLRRKKKL